MRAAQLQEGRGFLRDQDITNGGLTAAVFLFALYSSSLNESVYMPRRVADRYPAMK